MLGGSCCDLAALCIGDEEGEEEGRWWGEEEEEREKEGREVGAFKVGWSQLNKTEEKKELQPVCVCVCVCVCAEVKEHQKNGEGLGTRPVPNIPE